MDNIVLMGHSIGADDTVTVSFAMKDKYNKDYFSALVMFSVSSKMSTYPYDSSKDIKNYFVTKRLRGYSENTLCHGFFDLTGIPLKVYKGTSHSGVPAKAFGEDENNDGISDLVYWLFAENTLN